MENLITEVAGNGYADSGVGSFSASFQRRIEFHPARKPFTVGLSNGGGGKSGGDGGGFKLETLNPDTSSDHSRLESGQAGKKKVDGSEFWDNGLDPELSFGMTFRRIGAGLENLGNTCFLNSVLQCLTYTEPLAAYLQSGKHQNSCRIVGFCALCAIQKHVSRALQAPGRILAPKDLVLNLRCISRNFRISRQEDAHEYMVNLLESMHKCCLPSGLPSESPGAYEKSLVHKIFGGRLRSQVKCVQCSYCSNKFDPFLDLSLEIAKADSVHKALTNFTAAEMLDGGEKQYQCQRCKQKVRALKQLTVHKAPYVLTVHLKRFRAHDPGQKIDKKVQFGPTLDMKPFVSGSYEGDLKYTLYGVLVHHGWSTHSGHYYCFVRTSSGMWYSLDDNRVVQVNERSVLEQKAYMLFYVRDRKNIVSRKPIDVQKENLKANVSATKAHSTMSQQPKEHLQGCPNQNGVWHADTSASVNQKVAVNGGLSKAIHVKEASSQPGRVLVECPASEKGNSLELSSKVPSLKNLSEGVSIPNPDKGKTLQPSVQSVNCNGVSPEFKSDSATNGANINNSKEKLSSKNDLEVSLTVSHNCNGPQVYVSNKLVTNETSQKINHVSNAEVSSMTPSQDSNDRTPERIPNMPHPGNSSDKMLEKYPIKSPNVPSCENIQVGEKYTTVGISPSEKSCDNSQTMGLESVEVSNPSVMKHESLDVEPLDCRDQRKLKKKKKVLNSQIRNIPLCLKFFRASLVLRKKKSKRSKYRITILSKELLLDKDNISSDVGPSKSESTSRITKTSCHFRKKVTKSTAQKNVKTCNGDSLMNVIDGELRERIHQDGAVLATDEQVPKHSGSVLESDQQNAVESGASKECRKDAPQEGMSKLTQGLKETTIPQWDGIDLPPEIVESNANETLSIGYILDEWDEEYDRGKRKKLRHYKHSFGEPNPFQEIATKKMPLKKIQLKKAKMSHTSSADQPFRI